MTIQTHIFKRDEKYMVRQQKGKSGNRQIPTTTEKKPMVAWFKDNILAIFVIVLSGVGTYTLAVNRISVLENQVMQIESVNKEVLEEVKELHTKNSKIELIAAERNVTLTKTLEEQQNRSLRNDKVIENNTLALTKIAILFAKVDTKLDSYGDRLDHLEERKR